MNKNKKKKKVDNSTKLFIYAWGVAFLTGAFLALYINRFNGHSKWLLIVGAITLTVAVSMLPLSILMGGIKDNFFRYGSQNTCIKIVRKDESPFFYHILIILDICFIIAVYAAGIILIKKFIL